MRDTLYNFHSNVLVVGLVTFGFMAVIVVDRALCVMTLAPLSAFISQIMLMLYFSKVGHTDYSEKTLFITVLIYLTMMETVFMLISTYYAGDTFLFSKVDAMLYYRESMKASSSGLINGIGYMMKTYDFSDWGALIFDTIVMYIFPQKLFLTFIYTILGPMSSLYMYRIGKKLMPEPYAFLAALAYSSSSFCIYYNCTFLKEALFLFIVIGSVYHLYQALTSPSHSSILSFLFFLTMISFFRPAVMAFIVVSIFVYFGITQRGKAISLFFYAGALAGLVVSFAMMQKLFDSYTLGGSMENLSSSRNNANYSSGFNIYVSYFGAYLGPFPTLFAKLTGPSHLEYIASGLVYKLFLVLPFWYGVYAAWKNKVVEFIPILFFILVEMTLTGSIFAALELRKVIVHVPFMFIVSFYGMYKGFVPNQLTRLSMLPTYLFAVGAMLLWNVLKVKG